ncbi:uncharacterized protein LOC131996035 [Stomoxys calcitrans]|uniref:uncharacterized protein LOC131996035 n=1 Tax=Stomoxys calcitrans TaxID=35570 RepID=UPI0027E278F3|nr:uncharacterized protein LOC131996035 [Stomoxys calcitrans]
MTPDFRLPSLDEIIMQMWKNMKLPGLVIEPELSGEMKLKANLRRTSKHFCTQILLLRIHFICWLGKLKNFLVDISIKVADFQNLFLSVHEYIYISNHICLVLISSFPLAITNQSDRQLSFLAKNHFCCCCRICLLGSCQRTTTSNRKSAQSAVNS